VPRRVSFQNARIKLIADCTTGKGLAFDLLQDPAEQAFRQSAVARALARLHLRRSERARIARLAARRPELAGPPAGRGPK